MVLLTHRVTLALVVFIVQMAIQFPHLDLDLFKFVFSAATNNITPDVHLYLLMLIIPFSRHWINPNVILFTPIEAIPLIRSVYVHEAKI